MSRHRILIPLDGSDFSRQIMPHVQRFFDPASCEVTLLHVAEPPETVYREVDRPQAEQRAAAEEPYIPSAGLRSYGSQLPKDHPDTSLGSPKRPVYQTQRMDTRRHELENEMAPSARPLRDAGYDVDIRIRFDDDPANTIVRVADEEDADLIAMTTQGRSGLSRLIFGSVAEAVMREASRPVMLLRPSEKAKNGG